MPMVLGRKMMSLYGTIIYLPDYDFAIKLQLILKLLTLQKLLQYL